MQKVFENVMFVCSLAAILLIGLLIHSVEKENEELELENKRLRIEKEELRQEIFELNNWIMKSEGK